MNFREAIAAIPFNSQRADATGLMPPIIRAIGHILYVVGALADANYNLSDQEAQVELQHATAHLTGTIAAAESAPVSSLAKERITAFVNAVFYANIEYNDWPEDERGRNLKDLADRAAMLAAFFDWELAGLHGSDPGRTL